MKSEFKFKIGQRVAEKPRINPNVCSSPQAHAIYKKNCHQRLGVVTGLLTKRNSRGQNRKYIQVKWDNRMQPSDHEQMRICAIEDLDKEIDSVFLAHG